MPESRISLAVRRVEDYPRYAAAMRQIAASQGYPDLEMLDIAFSNAYKQQSGPERGVRW